MPDTVTLVLDAQQYYRELAAITAGNQRLSRSGEAIGGGFLRGERVIRTASANIAASLLSSGDAATTALVAMQGLERVFKIGILPTIGVAAAVAIFEVFRRQVERTNEAAKALSEELKKPFSAQVKLSATDLGSDIDALTTKMEGLRKEIESNTTAVLKFLGVGQGFGGSVGGLKAGIAPTIPDQFGADKERQLAEAAERRRKLLAAAANLELEIAQSKEDALTQDKESQDIAKANLEFKQKEAKLLEEVTTKGISQSDFVLRTKALDITRAAAIAQAHITAELQKQNDLEKSNADLQSRSQRQLKDQIGKAKEVTDFFQDVGSGKFVQNLAAEQLKEQQQERGKQVVSELQEARRQGVPLGPNAQAILKAAEREAGRMSIEDLLHADFRNLLELSQYDFSGLEPLNGLTVTIQ